VGQTTQKEVGATAIAQVRLIETERREASLSELSSFENLLLLEEVVTLLQRHHFARFVLFVDEANKLTLEANACIIRDNLALFSSNGIQFCFVTTPEVVAASSSFNELFQRRIEIGPFDSIDNLRALVQHNCRVDGRPSEAAEIFSSEALEAIWRISRGFPFKIQLLCQKSLDRTLKDGRLQVNISDVLDVIGTS
jgi:type II secretory pathway predicted ATPase ExeA